MNVYADISKKEACRIALSEMLKEDLSDKVSKHRPYIYDSDKIQRGDKNVNSFLHIADIYELNGKPRFKTSWVVMFRPKMISLSMGFVVVVNKSDGKILYSYHDTVAKSIVDGAFKEEVYIHKAYIQAAIEFHKKNGVWPKNVDDIKQNLQSVKLRLEQQRADVLVLSFSDFPWAYSVVFVDNEYKVNLVGNDNFKSESVEEFIRTMINNISQKYQ